MTQSAIVRGLAKWAAKNMTKEFSAGSITRIGFDALMRIANVSPSMAIQMALAKFPSIAPVISTIKDSKTFDVAWNALVESVEENGDIPLEVVEVPFGPVRVFRIKSGDLDAIRREMDCAYKDELESAKAVEAAGNGGKSQLLR